MGHVSSSNFLEAEVRCDFFVSSEIKRLWKIQLDILELFIKICKKYNFRYSLYAGNLLGAVRHKGYIPWDDDLDVAMPRKDYDKFLEVASKELSPPYELQCAVTDQNWPFGFAKIRNGHTAAIEKNNFTNHYTGNQGIFIDIFPLDLIYSDSFRRLNTYKKYKKHFNILYNAKKVKFVAMNWKNRRDNILFKVLHFCNVVKCNFFALVKHLNAKFIVQINGGYLSFYNKTEDIFRKLDPNECDSICDCTFCAIGNQNAKVYDKYLYEFNNFLKVKYEYLQVEIPRHFDIILTQKFGDWHKMVRGGSFHSFVEFSDKKGYKDILIEKYGYKKKDFS